MYLLYLIRSHGFVSGMRPFDPAASYKSQGGVYVSDADGCTIWKKTTTGEKSLVVGSELSHGALHIVSAVSVMMLWECHHSLRCSVAGGACGFSTSQLYFPAGLVVPWECFRAHGI